MKSINLLKKISGIHTIVSIAAALKVSRKKAVYYVYRLRKKGYVRTRRISDGIRVYDISLENRLGGKDYYEIINANSAVKISAPVHYKIYGRAVSLEETLVYAVKTGSFRTILAALALFKKVNNWPLLYSLAKANGLQRNICALYFLAKKIMRVRRMPLRFKNNCLPKKTQGFEFIIPGLSSDDFKDVQKVWKIYLPFNKKDLGEYK